MTDYYDDADELELEDPAELDLEHLVARVNFMKAEADRRFGTRLTERDPEYRAVRWNSPDGEVFLESYLKALAKKAERLGLKPQQPALQQAQQPAQQPGETPASQQSLRAQYNKEMEQLLRVGASSEQKIQLRQKYRRLGLSI